MDNLIASVALFTNPTVIARQIMAGLANGVLLFLVASGLSLIFGLSRIINFAHGALFMLGAYFAYSVVGAAQTDLFTFFLMLLASTVGLFIFGVAFEMAVLRRIYRSAQAFQLLVTFGLVLILSDAVRLIAGPAEKSVQLPVALEGFPPIWSNFSCLSGRPDRNRPLHRYRTLGAALSHPLGNSGSSCYG